ncbi:DUF4442 domain-containing protein [Nocardia sp. ET3-3]|uniref:DUF4442 domain-containing protein n=1 Tax=Nocardia terrae TaxID=2675851 RepID=A0A7K1UP15_9NOCA|nr:DUF4442 domain-containing protein [Nocardia terrae]MVU76061.1 DUF4442 domain-containing protein [Nocardia terrae]
MKNDSALVRRIMSPSTFRIGMSLYPPLLFAGVRVEHIADDWTSVRVRHRVSWWNRNHNGAAFGGTLSAMTDPFFGLMAAQQLGPGYVVWNTSVSTRFLKPGRGTVTATMQLTPDETSAMRAATADGGKSVTSHSTEIVASDGSVIARAEQQVYVRRAKTASTEQHQPTSVALDELAQNGTPSTAK